MKNEIKFTEKVDGKDVEFLVRKPTLKESAKAQEVYNQAFASAINSKAILRERLNDVLKAQGLWNDEKEVRYNTLNAEIEEAIESLKAGGKLDDAYKTALKIRNLRNERLALISSRLGLDSSTVEGQSDNARFNCLVSLCLVYNDTKKPFFASYEDYLNDSGSAVGSAGATHLASLLYNYDENVEKTYPENKFLAKFKFVDDKLRLINKEGKLVDEDGRLVNDKGQWVNKDGKLEDKNGKLIEEEIVFGDFFDNDGNKVEGVDEAVIEGIVVTPEPPVKKSAAKKTVEE